MRQVHGPVQPQHVAVELAHFFEPQATAFGEYDARNYRAIVRPLELAQHPRRVSQAERLKGAVREYAAPTVKDHHRLRPGIDLRVEVGGDGVRIDR